MRGPAPKEEKLLFNKIAKGDEVAFRIIYDAYFDLLAAYVLKMSKSEDVAKEIVQDTFMKLWTDRTGLHNIESPQAYIFAMARNRTIDFLRKLVKETNTIALLSEQVRYHANSAEERFDTQELQKFISEAISKLSPQKQTIFQLSKFEDFTHDEIAEELNLSKSTIKNHLSETVQYLRKSLNARLNSETLMLFLLIAYLKKQ